MLKKGKKTFLTKDRGLRFVNRFDVADLFDLSFFDHWTKDRPIIYGLCGGMCFTALDLFYENLPVPQVATPPENETPLYKYLLKRQIDSLSLDTLANVIRWTLEDDRDVALWTAREEIPQIQASLDEGTPVVLALVRVRKGNPTANHQVLAIDYTLDEETQQMELTLYDPNHPGEEPKIFVDLRDPEKGLHPRQSTGEPLRGFFVIRYKKEKPQI
ncbi:MAG: hypothetical protein Fur0022_35710 [Anaerolineales bacterium]